MCVLPDTDPNQAWIKKVLAELPNNQGEIKAAVLVHPTYQGYANDPTEIIATLQEQGLSVLVDEAHGSHLAAAIDPDLPPSSLHCGADLVVHSLHKSAAGLAQTAVLWHQGQRVDPERVERCLGWIQTTSPSALLLASCESALQQLASPRGRRDLANRINEARLLKSRLIQSGVPLIDTQDPLRIVLHTGSAGISGVDADEWFIKNGLIAELPEPGTLTFCLGFVVCRDRLFFIYPPIAPLESGSAWRPAIYQSAQAVPEEFLIKESEEKPIQRKGIKVLEN